MSSDEPETLLTPECGHHCGVKDGITGHCNCLECHERITAHVKLIGPTLDGKSKFHA